MREARFRRIKDSDALPVLPIQCWFFDDGTQDPSCDEVEEDRAKEAQLDQFTDDSQNSTLERYDDKKISFSDSGSCSKKVTEYEQADAPDSNAAQNSEMTILSNNSAEEISESALNQKNNSPSVNVNGERKTFGEKLGMEKSVLMLIAEMSSQHLEQHSVIPKSVSANNSETFPAGQPEEQHNLGSTASDSSNNSPPPSTVIESSNSPPPASSSNGRKKNSQPTSADKSIINKQVRVSEQSVSQQFCSKSLGHRSASGFGSGPSPPSQLQDKGSGSSSPTGSSSCPRDESDRTGKGNEKAQSGRDGKSNRKNTGRKKHSSQTNEGSENPSAKPNSTLLRLSCHPTQATTFTSPPFGSSRPVEGKALSSSKPKKPPDPSLLTERNTGRKEDSFRPNDLPHEAVVPPKVKKPPDLKELALPNDAVVSHVELSPTKVNVSVSVSILEAQLLLPCEETLSPKLPSFLPNGHNHDHTQPVQLDLTFVKGFSILVENELPSLELTLTGKPPPEAGSYVNQNYQLFSSPYNFVQEVVELEDDSTNTLCL